MKNRNYFLIFFVISLFFIAGCTDQKVVCNKPYILVGTGCCLDKDNNNICDKDETQEVPVAQEVVVSNCYLPGNVAGSTTLGCSNFKVENKIINFILKSNDAKIISIIDIELPNIGKSGCSKTFEPSFEQAMKYHDTKEYELTCDFGEENSFYSDIFITYMVYDEKGNLIKIGNNVANNTVTGYIEGMVK